MLNNEKGFSLIEVLAALAIFVMAVSACFPMLIHIYRERMAIEEEYQALDILHNRIQRTLLGGTVPEDTNQFLHNASVVYRVTYEEARESDWTKVCIAWTASNERRYKRCGYTVIHVDTP
ncbi:MAG TPA: type II secretion system protein [Bacillales bacterium]|nr:type II secretion system protein [Bacillales bacterium]